MSPIEINFQQGYKLTEMCRVLFPQYKLQTTSNTDRGKKDTGHIGYAYGSVLIPRLEWANETDYIVYDKIHWFEFCMTHLMRVLNSSWYDYTRWLTEEGETHLVDYLYMQFERQRK